MKLFFLLFIVGCGGDKIKLNQKSGSGFNAWDVKQSSCKPTWQKVITTITHLETCVAKKNVSDGNKCDIYSKYWLIGSSDVNIVYIDVRGSGVNCTMHPYRCTPQFEFKAYIGQDGGATLDTDYKRIAMIPSNPVKGSDPRFFNYDEVNTIDAIGKTALQLLFRTTYFCGQVNKVNVYYYTCPSISNKLIKFATQNAPDKANSPSKIFGSCVDYSVKVTKELYMMCHFDGTSTVSGECACKAGYEKIDEKCKGIIYVEVITKY